MTDRRSRLLAGVRLYWLLISASLRAKMQYKFDFLTGTIIQGLVGIYDYLIVAVILSRFGTVKGWDIWEVGLLYAVAKIGWGVYRTIGEELDRFEGYIVRGDFDSVLVRPWPSLFVVLSRNIELTRLGWVIEGIAVGTVSFPRLMWTGALGWPDLASLALATLCTAGLYLAVGIATSSAAFRIVRIEELQVFTQNAPGTAVLYPLEIYPSWLRLLLLSVIPLGVGNYIPIRYILGKGGSWLNLALPPILTLAALWTSFMLWQAGERTYHSTGS